METRSRGIITKTWPMVRFWPWTGKVANNGAINRSQFNFSLRFHLMFENFWEKHQKTWFVYGFLDVWGIWVAMVFWCYFGGSPTSGLHLHMVLVETARRLGRHGLRPGIPGTQMTILFWWKVDKLCVGFLIPGTQTVVMLISCVLFLVCSVLVL